MPSFATSSVTNAEVHGADTLPDQCYGPHPLHQHRHCSLHHPGHHSHNPHPPTPPLHAHTTYMVLSTQQPPPSRAQPSLLVCVLLSALIPHHIDHQQLARHRNTASLTRLANLRSYQHNSSLDTPPPHNNVPLAPTRPTNVRGRLRNRNILDVQRADHGRDWSGRERRA